jgi:hypothetical protein
MVSDPHHPLKGRGFRCPDTGLAGVYTARLLQALGGRIADPQPRAAPLDATFDWATSGLMPLTGDPSGPPEQGPAALPTTARGALDAFRLVADSHILPGYSGASLLSERAALLGLTRQGRVSCNGSCRLLRAKNRWVALNLARADDWDMLPALFETDQAVRTEDELSHHVSRSSGEDLVDRGRLMGLPVALVGGTIKGEAAWHRLVAHGAFARVARPPGTTPLVVDLSSLWAGPLATHLLQQAGARVIKVESTARPDGARAGAAGFFDLLNSGKQSVPLDLTSSRGRRQLGSLLSHADIVIEASRPRALAHMGIDAEALVRSTPGQVWVSITGYGRREPESQWVAWGDDAAVAAGAWGGALDAPVFCGDALADPLTGLHAAVLALAFWQGGESVLLDLSLREVTRHALAFAPHTPKGSVFRQEDGWYMTAEGHTAAVTNPEERTAQSTAATLGAHTRPVLEEFDIPC